MGLAPSAWPLVDDITQMCIYIQFSPLFLIPEITAQAKLPYQPVMLPVALGHLFNEAPRDGFGANASSDKTASHVVKLGLRRLMGPACLG